MQERRQHSNRMYDILENKLQENANRRGNIIFNSLGSHKRATSKHSGNTTPVADPKVYNLIGKLHMRSNLLPNNQNPTSD